MQISPFAFFFLEFWILLCALVRRYSLSYSPFIRTIIHLLSYAGRKHTTCSYYVSLVDSTPLVSYYVPLVKNTLLALYYVPYNAHHQCQEMAKPPSSSGKTSNTTNVSQNNHYYHYLFKGPIQRQTLANNLLDVRETDFGVTGLSTLILIKCNTCSMFIAGESYTYQWLFLSYHLVAKVQRQ